LSPKTTALVYLDNAATSWPKPPEVARAMVDFLENVGANPGRAGHRQAVEAGRRLNDAREALAEIFGVGDPLRIVFTHNVTESLNLALRGLLRPGDHVVTTSIEHNSMMRPLRALEAQGVALAVVPAAPDGTIDAGRIAAALRPETRLVAVNHASNVVGTIAPVAEIGGLARRAGVPLLVDAASTAGCVPIDVQRDGIDLLAFTGHKSLLGPTGTGGLIVGERIDMTRFAPLKRGGTGSRSNSEIQPDFLPDALESGTPNVVGLVGLAAAVRWILAWGVDRLRERQRAVVHRLLAGLAGVEGVTAHGTGDAGRQTAAVSFNLAGWPPSAVGLALDERFGVLCRVGLHCAPAAHRTIGTFPDGTVRFAPGPFTTDAEIDFAVDAVRRLAESTHE